MDLEKRLQKIIEHFATVSAEELKENLKVAGLGTIESCESEGMMLKPIERSKTSRY